MDFFNIKGKTFLISGASNKKSVATQVALKLKALGAQVIFTVQSEEHQKRIEKIFPEEKKFILDVQNENDLLALQKNLTESQIQLDGLLHSLAYAHLQPSLPFHATPWEDFAQATQISSYSLMALSNALQELFSPQASVVTISISDTKATSYGYMGPIKASLEAMVSYLAKSFSEFSEIRFNAVCSGPLKTSASAGIPNYIDNYLFAEELTMRKRALQTSEVANVTTFLLSPLSSGINATGILVDAGMRSNHFDQSVVQSFVRTGP